MSCSLRFPDDPELKQLLQLADTIPPVDSWFGDYKLVRLLGRGGMGIVYEARHEEVEHRVALKLLLDGEFASEALERLFLREAEAAANLDHPNVVPVFYVGKQEGRPFFTMRLIPGGNLQDALGRRGQSAGSRATHLEDARLMSRVARGVQHAHERGLLHRDLKPANILLDELGQPHLTDFGLAIRMDAAADDGARAMAGTLPYMAPEQVVGENKDLTMATDIYGLGAILYELLAGRAPFHDTAAAALEQRICDAQPVRPPRELNREIPEELERVCLKCLSKDPAARYASAAELADDLECVARGAAPSLRPSSRWGRAIHCVRRNPRRAQRVAQGLLGALLLVSSVVYLWLAADREQRSELDINAAIASGQAGAALFQLHEYADRVHESARDPALIDLAAAGQVAPDTPLVLKRLFEVFDTVFVLAPDGRLISLLVHSPVRDVLDRSYDFRDYFRGAEELVEERRRSVHVARAFRSESDGELKFGVSAPLFLNDAWVGVVVAIVAADSVFGKVRMRDVPDRGRVSALLGPRDVDRDEAKREPRPERFVVLVHDGLRRGAELAAPGAPGLLAAFRAASHASEPFSLKYPPPQHELDYRDPVPGYEGRWLAAFAPVGGTGYVVVVQTRRGESVQRLLALASRSKLLGAGLSAAGLWLTLLALLRARRRSSPRPI